MSEPELSTEQPLLAHLIELRTRIVRAMLGFMVVLLPLLFFAGKLYHFLAEPMMKLLPAGSSMIATEVVYGLLATILMSLNEEDHEGEEH